MSKLTAEEGVTLLNNALHGLVHGLDVVAPNECFRRQIEDEAASGLELEEICHQSDSSLQREPSQMVIDGSGTSSGAPPASAVTGEHYSPEVLHQIVMTLEDRVHTLEGEVAQLSASREEMLRKLQAYENSSSLLF
eukprot:1489896-Amphidinium_carterae.2